MCNIALHATHLYFRTFLPFSHWLFLTDISNGAKGFLDVIFRALLQMSKANDAVANVHQKHLTQRRATYRDCTAYGWAI